MSDRFLIHAGPRFEAALRRDHIMVVASLVLVLAISWSYLLSGAGTGMSAFEMSSLPMALGEPDRASMDMSGSAVFGPAMAATATPADWTMEYALLMFGMWWIMMTAMMLPSAAPMILTHATILRRSSSQTGETGETGETGGTGGTGPATVVFALGYLMAWALFSAIAATLQWALEMSGVLSPMTMSSTNVVFAGSILLLAGAYQLTKLKQACLESCRGPIAFLARHWRPGVGGAAAMGLRHGLYCLGCCWGLMAILFFGGVMNLYWIIGLALLVLVEKLVPIGPRFAKVTGAVLALWGAVLIQAAII